jgi:hypothetical protein
MTAPRDPTDTRELDADVSASERTDALKQRQAVEDLKWLVAHKPGRRLAWAWMARAGVFRNPFHTSGSLMAAQCGEMKMGQALLAEIMEHAPDAFLTMLKESKTDA